MPLSFFQGKSRAFRLLALATGIYVLSYLLYMILTVPETFRADFLYHLIKITDWDKAGDYGKFLPFIFEFQSGHIIALQKIFALTNYYLFDESTQFSKIFGLALVFLYWAFPVSQWLKKNPTALSALAALLLALLVFSPHQSEIYTWTDAIPAHYPAATLGLAALLAAGRGMQEKHIGWFLLSALAVGGTVVSNGSGWSILPALVLLAIFTRWEEWKKALPLKTLFVAALALAALGFWVLQHMNAGQEQQFFQGPARALQSPHHYIMHCLATVAAPWVLFELKYSWFAGLLVVAAAFFMIRASLRHGTAQSPVWIALCFYGFISCALVSLTRYDRDFELGEVTYRYAFYALPIYTGLLGMLVSLRSVWDLKSLPSVSRYAFMALACIMGIAFAFSTARAYHMEEGQNQIVRTATRAISQWNLYAAFRLASSYELPNLFLNTMPKLKASGRAQRITGDFIPTGQSNAHIDKAIAAVKAGGYTHAAQSKICGDMPDARLFPTEWDERVLPRTRKHGAPFVRLVGYLRDKTNCDRIFDYLIALDASNRPLCTSRSGTQIYYDLPEDLQKMEVMHGPFAFDFSCPILKEKSRVFPIRIFGYNSSSGVLALAGTTASATMPRDIPK